MKYHPICKLLAIILAACMLLMCAVSTFGIIFLSNEGLYTGTIEDWQYNKVEFKAECMAIRLLQRYAARELGKYSSDMYTDMLFSDAALSLQYGIDTTHWDYSIVDADGHFVESSYTGHLQSEDTMTFSFVLDWDHPMYAEDPYSIDSATVYRYQSPLYTVTVRMSPDVVAETSYMSLDQITALYNLRYWIIGIFLAALLLFAVCIVYLCFAAGRSGDGTQLRPAGLNKLPLDLYLVAAGALCFGGVYVSFMILDAWLWQNGLDLGILILAIALLAAVAVVAIAFLFAAAAQLKMPHGYWWRHTLIGRILRLFVRFFRFMGRGLRAVFRLLPLTWQWLLTGLGMGFFSIFFFYLAAVDRSFWLLPFAISVLCSIAVVCYGAYAFGTLRKGAQRLAQGDLTAKVSTKYLIGAFREFGQQLNSTADAAAIAAKNLTKSERMKTELITNVSHDIKTPLTSIINYVDILEKPHTEEEGKQYLDVLHRQSLRLKKLTDDLMEMSKATTGNMATDITPMDLSEAVNQALGEFADKLALCNLTPLFSCPEQPAMVAADGKITWRVLSNLLSNITKYGMPGTRVYLDIHRFDNKVVLSLKNISREELNISAEELTERFVRGDVSRNTEGSGLGLHIAKSMMELQHGQLNLLLDGDLFKVTLTFLAA